jgi:hypothetical protein
MAIRYSGQYASAQLDKLQLPRSLLLEIAEYIEHRDYDLLLPPTYRTFARMLGRCPKDHYIGDGGDVGFKAFDYELSNYRGVVTAVSMSMRGMRLMRTFMRAPLELIRSEVGACMLFEVEANVQHTLDDREFFRRWREQHNIDWPRTRDHTIHRKLLRPVERYCSFSVRHEEHARFAERIIRRYNSALNVVSAFRNDDDYDSDSD